ncbi:MAG: AAA family ATPase [Actinomycetales bacterium]|nr:AAA family ATPase [Actinomycetales bacterium]
MTALSPPAEPRLYLLQGAPAVGKLTLALELERRTGAIVVDNHLVNNAVFVPMGLGRDPEVSLEQTDALRDRVREVVYEAALAAPGALSHVFTFWLPDSPENAEHAERLRLLAERRGARFVPVWLTASREALLARVAAPGRAERSKLVEPGVLSELLEKPQLPAPADAMVLDLSDTTPEQAVEGLLAALA